MRAMTEPTLPLVICVTGAECTGKTTLASRLAAELNAPLVAEVARDYLAERSGYQSDDLVAIARIRASQELIALSQARSVVVADTDLTVIQVWWEEKYGALDDTLRALLAERTPRRYLLPQPDLPWEFDPLRESPHDRPRLHARYREILDAGPFPYAEISGVGESRFEQAMTRVRAWVAERSS
jgi:nicotinamide riboside kinase